MDQELNPEWVTPALIVSHSDSCPLRTTIHCFLNKKNWSKLEKKPLYTYTFYLRTPSCNTRSKALDISKKRPLTSNEKLQSNEAYIWWIIEISWCMQESPGMKLDWLSKLFSIKCWKVISKMSSKKFDNETGR